MIRFAQLTFGILHRAIHPLGLRRIRTWQGSASHFFHEDDKLSVRYISLIFANIPVWSHRQKLDLNSTLPKQLKISKMAQVTYALASHVGVCRGARFSFSPTKKPIPLKTPSWDATPHARGGWQNIAPCRDLRSSSEITRKMGQYAFSYPTLGAEKIFTGK